MAHFLLHGDPESFASWQTHPCMSGTSACVVTTLLQSYVLRQYPGHLYVCHACAACCRMSKLQGNERRTYRDTMGDRRIFLPDTYSSSPRRDAPLLRHPDFRTPYILPYQGSERQYLGKSIAHSPVLGSIVVKRLNPDMAKNNGFQSMSAEQAKVGTVTWIH